MAAVMLALIYTLIGVMGALAGFLVAWLIFNN